LEIKICGKDITAEATQISLGMESSDRVLLTSIYKLPPALTIEVEKCSMKIEGRKRE
jgi:hypothetical protein